LWAADLNGDGAADLLTAGNLLLNNGDGTFQSPIALGYDTTWLASADFNGDGNVDLALGGTQIVVLLGNGDGTFKAPIYSVGPIGGLAAGDVNSDGKVDLVVFQSGMIGPSTVSPSVSVLLGNGDGTFNHATNYPVVGSGITGSVADFNGDGKPDIVVIGGAGVFVFVNNGDGAFQPPVGYGAGPASTGAFTIADFDGDGKLDIGVANVNPDSSFPNFQDGTVHILLNGQFALVGLLSSKNPSDDGQPVMFTAVVKSSLPGSALVPSGIVTLQDGAAMLGSATLSGGTATFSSVSLGAGTHQLIARYSGDDNFRPGNGGVHQLVAAPDFSVSTSRVNPGSVNAGQSATATVTINSIGGFGGSVSLSCSVSPMPAQAPMCLLNPSSVQVAGDNSLTSTLTISTTAPTTVSVVHQRNSLFVLLVFFPAIVIGGVWRTSRLLKTSLRILLGCCLISATILQIGCGGGSGQQTKGGGTPSGKYTVKLQASSGGVKHATTLLLNVN
jgi:hypothetical protein